MASRNAEIPDRSAAAEWMLVATTACWGLSFPLLKDWLDAGSARSIGPAISYFTVMAMRMALAVVVLGVFRPRLLLVATPREHAVGVLLGGVTFVGSALQGLGLVWTTPADSAFITSLCSVWVPLLAWLLFRIRVPMLTILGLALGMLGTLVLSLRAIEQTHWGRGETLTVLCTLVFAAQILLLDRLGKTINSAHITPAYFSVYGLGSLGCAVGLAMHGPGLQDWASNVREMVDEPHMLASLLALSVFCTVLAFHWMNTYQPRTTASRAALIYLLEPIWAALFSLIMNHDQLTIFLVVGGVLILAGNLIAEFPRWRTDRRLRRAETAVTNTLSS